MEMSEWFLQSSASTHPQMHAGTASGGPSLQGMFGQKLVKTPDGFPLMFNRSRKLIC